jgi:hypothetical protein
MSIVTGSNMRGAFGGVGVYNVFDLCQGNRDVKAFVISLTVGALTLPWNRALAM